MPLTAGTWVGLGVGIAIGFATRRARLCTFGAIEDATEGGDYRRLKILGLALAIALLGTQSLIIMGYMTPAETLHLPLRSPILSILVGSLMFGFGMALVGTCAFGSLIKVGSGDLRSLIVIFIFGTAAFATLRGIFAPLRINFVETISFSMPGGHLAGIVEVAEGLTGFALRLPFTLFIAGILIAFVVREKRLHKARRLISAAVLLGAGVVIGWLVTAVFVDEFEHKRVQSLTFVSPVARGLFSTIMGSSEWLDFSAMGAIGVILGAFISARIADEFRWEAFDDHYEMKRHMLGAVLMGIGGVLAGGCTIGQGLSASSLLALSAPLAIIGMIMGARLGIAILVEGSPRYILLSNLQRIRAFFYMR
jgi:uncharacterized protein